ncbi:MAG: HAMP domain-containing histidine kinase [Clostridiales bacterium]|nr:HAMP domain-containing histidine kinase [Clostridiales bacterium]
MKVWICLLVIVVVMIIMMLSVKIYLLRKSAREISVSFRDRMTNETNTLIDISSHDKSMLELANEVNQQLEELYKQRHRFYQGNLELTEAITNISHDLRTPLTAICAYLDLLKPEEKSVLVNKYLDKIENRTVALRQLTEELFRYTVAASDVENVSFENVVINRVLEESISSYYAVIKSAKIVPYIEIPDKSVECVLDKNSLSRIFENILSNAVKYSDGDLNITLQENGKITFSNHAYHLTETQVARLFDRFYTVNTARQSTGLGLSIAKLLVEKMNGTIFASYENDIVTICVDFSKLQNEY